jgi:YVTN family beta-propeller protein
LQNGVILNVSKNLPRVVWSGRCRVNARCRVKRSSRSAKVYVGNFADNTVSAIDTSTGSVVTTIPVATGPHGMAISQDGGTVYVAGDGSSSLDIIDTASDRVTKTVEVGKKRTASR